MDKKNKLNAKQYLFCQEYMVDLNATQAAIRAGYSKKTAHRSGAQNMQKYAITERISELKKERSEEIKIDARWVLEQAVDLHKTCAQKVLTEEVNRSGDQVFKTLDQSGANKSLELIAKHVDVSAFEEKIKVDAIIKTKSLDDLYEEMEND